MPPVKFIVEGLLPQGLTVFASPPKFGKSWFALDLCLAVTSGKRFLNRSTDKGGALYLALEDSFCRLQERIDTVLDGEPVPKDFDISIKAASLSCGLLEQLEEYLKDRPWTSLVVIDTLQKIRDVSGFNNNVYANDYNDLSGLKAVADQYGVCVLLIHHLRKGFDADIFNRISGSNGVIGVSDTVLALAKAKRNDIEATLSITGRDVEETELLLKFDKTTCRWQLVGDAKEEAEQKKMETYQSDPLVKTVKKLMKENPDGFSMTAESIREVCSDNIGSAKTVGRRIRKIAPQLLAFDNILYRSPDNGRPDGERKHSFSYKNIGQTTLPGVDNM